MKYTILLWALRLYVLVFRRPSITIKGPDGTPYLTRWRLFGSFRAPESRAPGKSGGDSEWGKPGRYLHFFHRSDWDRDLHNHPWEWCRVTVLGGGYLEERASHRDHVGAPQLTNQRVLIRRAGARYTLLPLHYHRTMLLDEDAGSWSLIHAGPKHGRRWGFARPDGFQYAGAKSEEGMTT